MWCYCMQTLLLRHSSAYLFPCHSLALPTPTPPHSPQGTVLPPLECTEMDRPAVEQMWHLSQAGGGPRPHYHGGGGGGRGYGGHPGGANPGGHPSARNGPGQAGGDRAHVPVAHLAPESQQFLQHELGRGGQPGPRGPGGYGPGYGGYGGGGGGGSVTFGQQQGMNVAAGRGMGRGGVGGVGCGREWGVWR